jgi:hypothetical protein
MTIYAATASSDCGCDERGCNCVRVMDTVDSGSIETLARSDGLSVLPAVAVSLHARSLVRFPPIRQFRGSQT